MGVHRSADLSDGDREIGPLRSFRICVVDLVYGF